jgi:hypothetical protein
MSLITLRYLPHGLYDTSMTGIENKLKPGWEVDEVKSIKMKCQQFYPTFKIITDFQCTSKHKEFKHALQTC